MSFPALLARFLRPYRRLLVMVVLLQFAQTVASLFLPSLNASIIDEGIAKGDTGTILRLGAIMLGVTLLQIAASVAAVYFSARVAMGVGRDLRGDVFRSVSAFSERELQQFGAPSLITRTTNDVQQVQMLVLMASTMMVTAPIAAIGGVVMALRQDLVLSWVLAVAVPVMIGAVGLVIVRMVPLFRTMQKRIDRVNGVLREQLTGIRVIRAFVREPEETARFAVVNDELTAVSLSAGRLFALMFPMVTIIINLSSVAVLWFGAFRIEAGGMQVGALTAFLSYLTQILMALMMTTMMTLMIPRAAVSGGRIAEVLTTVPSVPAPAAPVTEVPRPGTIEFDHVTFCYPGAEKAVLDDISFTVEAGSSVAIVGSTGAGKTTIVNLATRLFDPTEGTVRIAGVDAAELAEATLYSQLALVPQKPYLFAGTIASTLRYGRPDATDAELEAALHLAQAADFVHAMPGGLDEPIAQGGTNVSGGQRQRLSIARALIARAPIMIFDDSFSALDTATDARLRRSLDDELPGVTRLVVAQRIATIVDADRILVIEDGRISAQGTHAELLDSSPAYAEIVESQLSLEDAA